MECYWEQEKRKKMEVRGRCSRQMANIWGRGHRNKDRCPRGATQTCHIWRYRGVRGGKHTHTHMFQLCCYLMRVWSWVGVCDCLLSPLIWEWLVKASSLTQWDQPSWVEGTHPCSRPAHALTHTHTHTHTCTRLHREKDATVESEHTSSCKWTIHTLALLFLSFHPAPRSPAPPKNQSIFLSISPLPFSLSEFLYFTLPPP